MQQNSLLQSLMKGVHSRLEEEISHGELQVAESPRPLQRVTEIIRLAESRSSPHFKSEFSEEQRKAVKKLKVELIKFQQTLQEKSREVKERQRVRREQERKSEEQRVRAESQRHHEAVLIRKKQRKLRLQQQQVQQSTPQRQPPTRHLYQDLQQLTQTQQERQQRQRIQLLSVLSQQRRALVNITRLGEHQQIYLRKRREERAERIRRMEEARAASRMIEEGEEKVMPKSRAYLRVIAEEAEQRRIAQEAQAERKRSQQRLKQFLLRVKSQAEVAQQRKPLRNTTRSKQNNSPAHIPRPNLTQMQLREVGDKFLRDSLQRIARQSPRRLVTDPNRDSKITKRPNYLQDLRKQREIQGNTRSMSQLQEGNIQKILGAPLTKDYKIEQLKRLAYRLEAGPPSADAEEELHKVYAKMRILEAALQARE